MYPSVLDVRVFSADCVQLLDPTLSDPTGPLAQDTRALALAKWIRADPEYLEALASSGSQPQSQLSDSLFPSSLDGSPWPDTQLTCTQVAGTQRAGTTGSGTPLTGSTLTGSTLTGSTLTGSTWTGSQLPFNPTDTAWRAPDTEINRQVRQFGALGVDIPQLASVTSGRKYPMLAGMVGKLMKGRSVYRKAHAAVYLHDDSAFEVLLNVFEENLSAPFPQFTGFHLLLARNAHVSTYLNRLEVKVSSVKDLLLLEPTKSTQLTGRLGTLARHAEAQRAIHDLAQEPNLDLEEILVPEPPPGFTLLAQLASRRSYSVYAVVVQVAQKWERTPTGQLRTLLTLADTSCPAFPVRFCPGPATTTEPGWAALDCIREHHVWRIRNFKVTWHEGRLEGFISQHGSVLVADPALVDSLPGDALGSWMLERVRKSQHIAQEATQSLLPAPALQLSAQFPRHKLVCCVTAGETFTAVCMIVANEQTTKGRVLTVADGSESSSLRKTASVLVPSASRKLRTLKPGYLVALDELRCVAECEMEAQDKSRPTQLTSSQPELRALRRRLACMRRSELQVSSDSKFVQQLFTLEWTFPRMPELVLVPA